MAELGVAAVVARLVDVLEAGGETYAIGGVFVPSIPLHDEAKHGRVRTRLADRDAWIHSAEVLAVFKMLFRPKDLVDVERMLQVQGAAFDRAFVHDALVEMLAEDPRIERWDEMCARNPT